MKKLLCSCLTIAVLIGVTSAVHAQPAPVTPPVAPVSTNASALTADQVSAVNNFVDGLLPYIPAPYIPLAGKIIGYLGIVAVIGRVIKGYAATGSVPGALWHFIAGVLFNHTPQPANASQVGQGAGARAQRAALILCLCAASMAFTGCTILDTQQGKVLSVTTRGLYVSVAATSNTTGTPEVKFGLGSQTMMLVPTSTTNGAVTIPNVADSSTIDQTINPFSTSGTETFAAGDFHVGQTNAASDTTPVVPK